MERQNLVPFYTLVGREIINSLTLFLGINSALNRLNPPPAGLGEPCLMVLNHFVVLIGDFLNQIVILHRKY